MVSQAGATRPFLYVLFYNHPAQVSPHQCGLGRGGVQGGGGFAHRREGDKGAEEYQGIEIMHSSVGKCNLPVEKLSVIRHTLLR